MSDIKGRPTHDALVTRDEPVVDIRFGPEFGVMSTRRKLAKVGMKRDTSFRLDLSRCQRFDVVALLHIVDVVAARSDSSGLTRFVLPRDEYARNFLRRQGFPAAVENVVEVPFRTLVDGSWFHGEEIPKTIGRPFKDAHSAIIAYLDDRQFFCLAHYDIGDELDKVPIIEREWRKWQNPLIVQVLKDRLSNNNAHDIARVVVQEMLTSLLTSFAPGDVVCGAQVQGFPKSDIPHLTIAAWYAPTTVNAADSLFDLLMEAIDRPGRREVFTIQVKSQSWRQKAVPGSLLARWMRVGRRRTSTPDHAVPVTDRSSALHPHQHDSFEALYRFVLDEFHGSIDFWSGGRSVSVEKRRNPEAPYHISVLENSRAENAGNIIAVRLPLSP